MVFHCPSQPNSDWNNVASSVNNYAYNSKAGSAGFSWWVKLSRVKNPGEKIIIIDAPSPSPPYTSVSLGTIGNTLDFVRESIPAGPHNKGPNILFIDGHAKLYRREDVTNSNIDVTSRGW